MTKASEKMRERTYDLVASSGANGMRAAEVGDHIGTSTQYAWLACEELCALRRMEKFRESRRDRYGIVRKGIFYRTTERPAE